MGFIGLNWFHGYHVFTGFGGAMVLLVLCVSCVFGVVAELLWTDEPPKWSTITTVIKLY